MIKEVPWTKAELAAMPEHPFYQLVPLGSRVKMRIPPTIQHMHDGREWLVVGHVRDDAAPIIAGKLSSRYVLTYPPREEQN